MKSRQIKGGLKGLSLHLGAEDTVARLFLGLLIFEVILVLLDAGINFFHGIPLGSIRRLFNIAREDSLAAWFASVQTLFVGVAAFLVFLEVRQSPKSIWRARGWAVLALFFTYLAVDDGASIHERVGTAFKEFNASRVPAASALSISHFPTYTWHLVFGPIFGSMGLFIFVFLWKELKENRRRLIFVLALACYVIAVGLDFVEGIDGFWMSDTAMHFAKVTEEFLEDLGSTLFLVTFVSHFIRLSPQVSIKFK